MHDVAVGDDVLLAFQPQLAGVARAGFAVQRDVVVIGDGLGADETLFEVGVDHAGRRRRLGAAMDGPGARFLRADRELGGGGGQPVARAAITREPRKVLRESFGLTIPEDVEVRVWDSSSEMRYWVLPQRPAGTEGWSEERLVELVTRDSMIGVGTVAAVA